MTNQENPPARVGTQGWQQFLTAKKEMLDAYDSAKKKGAKRKVQTLHGKVAEAEFRL
jgi:hypothetical protein